MKPSYTTDVAFNPAQSIMPAMIRTIRILPIVVSVCALGLCGCSILEAALPTATSTPAPPTATPEPAAALVNGESIRLVDFEQEVQRYESAKNDAGIDLATLGDYRSQVLQALIERKLLAQGARQVGIVIEESS